MNETNAEAQSVTDTEQSPSALENFLAHYKKLNAPGYAVLVTGEWGVGKTFQVKRALKEDKTYYASLFGIDTVAEAHGEILAQVLAAMVPVEDGLWAFFKAPVKFLKLSRFDSALVAAVPAVMSAVMKRNTKINHVLVLDDLERSNLDVFQKQGIINAYVEHQGCRVVVIAHDEKIVGDFTSTKEKTIGQTIRVKPEVKAAFDYFADTMNFGEKKKLLIKHKADILRVFDESQSNSLRVLKRVLENLGRFLACLEDQHLANEESMKFVIKLFCALDIEVRHNWLTEQDLHDRANNYHTYMYASHARKNEDNPAQSDEHEETAPNIHIAQEKYISVDVTSTMINDELAVNMFVRGYFNAVEILDSVNDSQYFITPEKSRAWRTVIEFDELEDDVTQNGVEYMRQEIESRVVMSPGDMLHTFALWLMLADAGATKKTLEQAEADCAAYIDDLLSNNELPMWSHGERSSLYNRSAYGGIGFWVGNVTREHFNRLRDKLFSALGCAFIEKFEKKKPLFLKMLQEDGARFKEMVSYTSSSAESIYAETPVLHIIPPEEFVNAWMFAPKKHWSDIAMGLRRRYRAGSLERDLATEKEWFAKVLELMELRAAKTSGLAASRIRRAIPRPE